MFALAEAGYASVFHQLVGCILSIRTRDEVSLEAALALFQAAGTPAALARMTGPRIDRLIAAVTFHESKARQIRAIAHRTVGEFGGDLPCDEAVLRSFSGVGPKCAHLALGVACGEALISVDIHVHRVTNRWGYVREPSPERTMAALQRKLPKKHWIEINALLVPFGKHICTGRLPMCSTCPVLRYCRQVGVTVHR
jgi:endonuclease III